MVVNIQTGTPPRIDVDSPWLLRRYAVDQISTNFYVISTGFFRCNFAVFQSFLCDGKFMSFPSYILIKGLIFDILSG